MYFHEALNAFDRIHRPCWDNKDAFITIEEDKLVFYTDEDWGEIIDTTMGDDYINEDDLTANDWDEYSVSQKTATGYDRTMEILMDGLPEEEANTLACLLSAVFEMHDHFDNLTDDEYNELEQYLFGED
jgi:hypothetical protein